MLLGVNQNKFDFRRERQPFKSDLKDPQGWDWVDVPIQWKNNEASEGKWSPYRGVRDYDYDNVNVSRPRFSSYN